MRIHLSRHSKSPALRKITEKILPKTERVPGVGEIIVHEDIEYTVRYVIHEIINEDYNYISTRVTAEDECI